MNTPVFTTGQTIDETSTAMYLFFLAMSLYAAPAQRPAKVPFARTVIIVPTASIPKNSAASPVRRTTIPNTSPSHAPVPMPYNAAPITIGISTSDIENVENLRKKPKN